MPKQLERRLQREADKKGYAGERKDRYVYGTLAKLRKMKKERGRERVG